MDLFSIYFCILWINCWTAFSDEFLSACSTLRCVGAENKTKQKTFTKGSADGVASPMAALVVRHWPSSISISHQNVNVEWINPHFYEKITISNSLKAQKHHVLTGLLIGSWDIWMQFSTLFYWLVSLDLLTIMPWNKSHKILLIINQYWFRQWVGVVRQQAITWANVDLDLCRHMPSLGKCLCIFEDQQCKFFSDISGFDLMNMYLTLLMLETEYSGFGVQCHACWCPGP